MGNRTGKKTETSTTRVMINSFVIIPLLVAISVVFIISLVKILTTSEKDVYDYLNDIKVGGASKRWQSAFELSKILDNSNLIPRNDRFYQEMINAFKQSEHDDNRVRQYMALAMGRTGDNRFIDPLLSELEDETTENKPSIIYALGLLKSSKAVEYLLPLLTHEEENIRLQTVIALGNIADSSVIESIKNILNDRQPNIRWDAAISLAKLGDSHGREILLDLLDEDYLTEFPDVDSRERDQARIIAIQAGILLNDPVINRKIKELAEYEANINIRKTALTVLKENTNSSN
ncbi:MAG: HEAT repeat domain-containing protein, partial [Candidatus Neomarinimicrobiota bacterium]